MKEDRTICPKCGNPKDQRAKLCRDCFVEKVRKERTPEHRAESMEEAERIAILAQSLGFVAMSKELGCSDNTVRRILRDWGLPTKKKALNEWVFNNMQLVEAYSY